MSVPRSSVGPFLTGGGTMRAGDFSGLLSRLVPAIFVVLHGAMEKHRQRYDFERT